MTRENEILDLIEGIEDAGLLEKIGKKLNKKFKSESQVSTDIELAIGNRDDTFLFRNNVGMAYNGKYDSKNKVIRYPKAITYGLAVGSSDYIGFRVQKIEPHMVGEEVAIFVGLEIKNEKGGKISPEQKNWHSFLLKNKALSGIVSNVEEAERVVNCHD